MISRAYIILEENTINVKSKLIKKESIGCPAFQTLSLMIIYFNNILTVLIIRRTCMGSRPNTRKRQDLYLTVPISLECLCAVQTEYKERINSQLNHSQLNSILVILLRWPNQGSLGMDRQLDIFSVECIILPPKYIR
jgi:hypothetical protein